MVYTVILVGDIKKCPPCIKVHKSLKYISEDCDFVKYKHLSKPLGACKSELSDEVVKLLNHSSETKKYGYIPMIYTKYKNKLEFRGGSESLPLIYNEISDIIDN